MSLLFYLASFQINDTLRFYVTLEDELGDDNVIHSGKNNLVQVEVSVIIADVNDNPPAFLGVSLSFSAT